MGYFDQDCFRTAVERVRRLDPSVQIRMGTPTEIARLEEIIERAEQKKATLPPTSYDVAYRTLHTYWREYNAARQQIIEDISVMKRDVRGYREIGTPMEYFQEPNAMGFKCPSFVGPDREAELNAFLERFSRLTIELKGRAQAIREHVRNFERLGPLERLERIVRKLSEIVELQGAEIAALKSAGGRNGKKH